MNLSPLNYVAIACLSVFLSMFLYFVFYFRKILRAEDAARRLHPSTVVLFATQGGLFVRRPTDQRKPPARKRHDSIEHITSSYEMTICDN